MSSSKEGFTEDDQARIAEEVQGRVSARRSGLGFGGLNPPSQDASKSCTGSSWFHQNAADSDIYKNIESDHDTTQGAFPWDGGQRSIKVGGVSRKKAAVTIPPPGEALSASGLSSEREFPMIRDRDIEHRKGGREGKRSRSRSRSRSVSRDRERKLSGRDREHRRRRDRSRSGSRDRGRGTRREVPLEAERERQRQRQRDRDRDRDRGRDRTRDRTRDRDKGVERDARRSDRRSRSPARDTRDTPRRSHCDNISDAGIERRDGHHVPSSVDRKPPRKVSSSLPTAVDTKVAIKRRLQKVAAADASLKTGFTATVGGGAGWERAEMSTASDFFKSDEVAAKGGVASVAPEYEARLAEILAVEDEETMCLGDGILKNATSASAEGHPKSLDPSTRAHHDAIFAPKGSDLSQPLSISQPVASASPTGRMTSNTGGMGAAARARLALTGKLGGTSMDEATPVLSKAIKKSKEKEDRQPNSQDNGDKPLFKTLRVGDSVEARYTVDDEWYKSVILQVIHGGFEIARYKVRYTEYSNEETLSWKRIRHVNSAPELPGEKEQAESQPVAPTTSTPPKSPRERQHKPVSSDKLSEQFAGMRPRSVKIETKKGEKSTEEDAQMEVETSEPAVDANVVNPSILSGGPGQKMSWKAKLKARKAAASVTAGSTNNVQNLPKKQVSLVPDFAAQKRERETDQVLDRSKWRAKVVFGIGSVKRTNS